MIVHFIVQGREICHKKLLPSTNYRKLLNYAHAARFKMIRHCRNFGELCCMKLVLAELLRDLRHRFATYSKTAKAEGSNSRLDGKRDALLQNCQLWRLLQVKMFRHKIT